ncbi:hypothetical protein M9H77_12276 [Catharanthus roseus]|uniref:Uncharacterized protein n=1 Tax=Catharanthus roseus TaxID=4058 RepID=A0ACC0BH16_CATRO|nr:hypothetical protein M9H77_12276 [Catharanthus roseus]
MGKEKERDLLGNTSVWWFQEFVVVIVDSVVSTSIAKRSCLTALLGYEIGWQKAQWLSLRNILLGRTGSRRGSAAVVKQLSFRKRIVHDDLEVHINLGRQQRNIVHVTTRLKWHTQQSREEHRILKSSKNLRSELHLHLLQILDILWRC